LKENKNNIMREILFKGKTIDNKWVYGDLIQIGGSTLIYHGDKQTVDEIKQEDSPCAVGFYPNQISPVKPNTVCQFTGKTDKNGIKIFKGDYDEDGNMVVWCERCNGWQFAQIDVPTKDICIPCHWCDGNFDYSEHIDDFIISGNIHDIKL